jgi:hypothetical protein
MSKKTIFLDLDETLISAQSAEKHDFQKEKKKSQFFDYDNMDDYYIIYHRPKVQEFLDYAFANFDVAVWTAASKDYMIFIINRVIHKKPGRKIKYAYWDYHCDKSSKHKNGTKDLTMLWDFYKCDGLSGSNVKIIDDYNEVKKTNKDMCISAPAFKYKKEGSEKDNYLMGDLKPKLDKWLKSS